MEEEVKLNPLVTTKPTNMEDVLQSLGGFGRFQLLILFLMLFLEIPTACLIFLPVFIGAPPTDWLCDGVQVPNSEACMCEGNLTAIDRSVSVVAEWELICGSSWVSDTIVSLQMSGFLVGNLYISQLSDWYGRRYCFLGITLQMALGTILTALSPNYYVYGLARFLCGAGFSGFLSVTAVYAVEFMTPKWRPIASSFGPFGEGIILLGLLAYYIRSWRCLVWASAIPFIAIIFIFPFVPESPRWLLRNHKLEECLKVLGYIARLNRKDNVDMETLHLIVNNERPGGGARTETQETLIHKSGDIESDEKNYKDAQIRTGIAAGVQRFSYLEFYRNPTLRKTTLCLQGIWFTWGVVYFGLSYNIKNMPGSPYLNLIYMGLVDAIGQKTVFLINNRLGRRKSLVVYMTFSAIFLVTIAVLQLVIDVESYVTLISVLSLLGRYGIAGGRSAVRTLTSESFPTAIRVMGIGFTGSAAALGGALAPQLVYLGSYWPSFPFFAFAFISAGGSSVSFLLRETNGQPLSEEIKGNKTKNMQLL